MSGMRNQRLAPYLHLLRLWSQAQHTLDISNVPGPQSSGFIAGQRARSIYVGLPNMLHQCILLSYNGTMFPCMAVDPSVVASPEELGEAYVLEMRQLCEDLGLDLDPFTVRL